MSFESSVMPEGFWDDVRAEYEQDEDLGGHWFDASRRAQSATMQQLERAEPPKTEDTSVTASMQLGQVLPSTQGEDMSVTAIEQLG